MSDDFVLMKDVAHCDSDALFIETLEQCRDAAAALEYDPNAVEKIVDSSLPHGCYIQGSDVSFNEAGNKTSDDTDRQPFA